MRPVCVRAGFEDLRDLKPKVRATSPARGYCKQGRRSCSPERAASRSGLRPACVRRGLLVADVLDICWSAPGRGGGSFFDLSGASIRAKPGAAAASRSGLRPAIRALGLAGRVPAIDSSHTHSSVRMLGNLMAIYS
jgi:hypothetical protein